jgi:hypothetical protein
VPDRGQLRDAGHVGIRLHPGLSTCPGRDLPGQLDGLLRASFPGKTVSGQDPASVDRAKDAELLVLRHKNAVLRRHTGRVRYEPGDRVWLAALARRIPRRRWTDVFPITPATLLAWHHKLAGSKYDTSKRRKPGRPPTLPSIGRLVVRLAKNPLWGHRRIHGELAKLGVTVAPSTVREILRAEGIDPAPRGSGPTWRQFLAVQAAGILAVDFLHVDTVLLKRMYVLVTWNPIAEGAVGRRPSSPARIPT